ncbi:MAG: RagB/SusD family nutrient uptake outer membrane protein [Bacteroidales bacterium]|nr:RagB/SusD family nutrient uptake outer membrane protein [Bacteroidales bacterium]
MKKINQIFKCIALSLLFMVVSSSCNEDEFMDVTNPNVLALSSFYKTPQDAEFAVNVCYTPQMHRGLYALNWWVLFNTFSDRILFETTGLDRIGINTGDGFVRNTFLDIYRMLWRSSHVIYNIEVNQDVMGIDDETVIKHKAQLKALQGFSYFLLVSVFNKPYFYDENSLPEDPEMIYGNSDQIEFWEGCQSSLEYAIQYLPETYEPANYGRVTKGMAQSLLGKALLYKYYHFYMRFEQTMTAEAEADLEYAKQLFYDVIYSGNYELSQPLDMSSQLDVVNAYQCNFSYIDLPSSDPEIMYDSENNRESVWEIQYSDERLDNVWLGGWLSTSNLLAQYFSGHVNSYKNHEGHPDLYYLFEDATGHPAGFEKDPRVYGTMYMDGDHLDFRDNEYNVPYATGTHNKRIAESRGLNRPGQPSASFGLKKYHYPTYVENIAPQGCPNNVRYIRLSDVMLMYAEVCMLLGDHSEGIIELNKVRARVGMPPKAAPITPQMIMNERDFELAFEGHRFLDLIRWSFDPQFAIDWLDIFDGDPIFKVGKNEYLPIPQFEIDVNEGGLEQNPGW